jgi:hypothetical protein
LVTALDARGSEGYTGMNTVLTTVERSYWRTVVRDTVTATPPTSPTRHNMSGCQRATT